MPPEFGPADFASFRRRHLVLLILAGLAGTAFAATAPRPYRTPDPLLRGKLTIVGARAMSGLVTRWVAIFRREHPDVAVIVAPAGSGASAAAMSDGAADVAPLTRLLGAAERELTQAANRDAHGVLVGFEPATGSPGRRPLVIYLNQAVGAPPNPIAAEFVRVALSPEGQRQIADRGPNAAQGTQPAVALRDPTGAAATMLR